MTAAPPQTPCQRVILADDDRDDAVLVSEAVAECSAGVEFLHLRDGDGLLEWLGTEAAAQPAIVLLDLNLPRRDGWSVLRAMQASHGSVFPQRIVIFSTSRNPEDMARAHAAGVEFVSKPETFSGTVALLRSLLTGGAG